MISVGNIERINNGYGTIVTKINDILSLDKYNKCHDLISSLATKIREYQKNRRQDGIIHEVVVFDNSSCDNPITFFSEVNISKEYKVTDKESFKNLFTYYDQDLFSFARYRQDLANTFMDPIIELLELLCKHKGASGKLLFRAHLKMFAGGTLASTDKLTNSLKWHYDYHAKTTIAMELYNEFSEVGTLLFAKNGFVGKPSGAYGKNRSEAEPKLETTLKVNYPKLGALLFDGFQGEQVHCSANVDVPINKERQNIYIRTIIQVVLYDDEWTKR